MNALRILATGVAAAAAWGGGLLFVFGPAQGILTDPALQSAKFLAVFTEPPLPRLAEQVEAFAMGLLLIGLIYACAFDWLSPRLPGRTLRKGLTFGLLAWALLVPWFEFYLPWNVMHEPLPLVLLEAFCWLAVMLFVGLAASFVNGKFRRAVPGSG